MYQPPALPPPGWYPDPERPGAIRWWDGRMWAAPTPLPTAPDGWRRTDDFPDLGDMISGAFRSAVRHWRALAVVGVVTAGVGGVLFQSALRYGVNGVSFDDDEVFGWSNDRIPVIVVLTVLGALVTSIGYLAAVWMTLRAGDEDAAAKAAGFPPAALTTAGEIDFAGRGLRAALGALPRAFGWLLLSWLAFVLAMTVVVSAMVFLLPLGVVLLLALFPLGVFVAVKLAFLGHAVVDARGNPYPRSVAVSRDRFWGTLGRMLLIGLIAGAANYGVTLVTSVASGSALGQFGRSPVMIDDSGEFERVDLDELAPSPWAITVSGIGAVATFVLSTSTVSAALAAMYRTRHPRRGG